MNAIPKLPRVELYFADGTTSVHSTAVDASSDGPMLKLRTTEGKQEALHCQSEGITMAVVFEANGREKRVYPGPGSV